MREEKELMPWKKRGPGSDRRANPKLSKEALNIQYLTKENNPSIYYL